MHVSFGLHACTSIKNDNYYYCLTSYPINCRNYSSLQKCYKASKPNDTQMLLLSQNKRKVLWAHSTDFTFIISSVVRIQYVVCDCINISWWLSVVEQFEHLYFMYCALKWNIHRQIQSLLKTCYNKLHSYILLVIWYVRISRLVMSKASF